MNVGDSATYRDPLSKKIATVVLQEEVKIFTGNGKNFRGYGFVVKDENGKHWTAQLHELKEETK